MNTGCYVVRWLGLFLLFCTGVIKGETLQGPNVNPAELACAGRMGKVHRSASGGHR